jgi:hypothetical protein
MTFRAQSRTLTVIPGSRSFSDSKSPVIGLTIELEPIRRLFIEFNGLYRPLHLTDESLLFGSGQPMLPKTIGHETVLTWEFPILAKYKLPTARAKPFFEIGPSFRSTRKCERRKSVELRRNWRRWS